MGARGRVLLYVLAFPGAVALDILTPLAIADWLLEVVLVWIVSVWGDRREMRVVAATASVAVIPGLWSSPATGTPFWMGALNRLAAIVLMWTMVHIAHHRRSAEEAQRKAAAEIKILKGLLPICAACKAIRNERGEWRRLESYLLDNSEAILTHGICPQCAAKFMKGLADLPTA
jgi:hypothetical protein